MKKNLTRILSLLLVLVLMVGVLPVSALADGWDLTGELDTEQLLERAEPVEMQASATVPYRIVHLDCGRKYFSVENIKKLIDTMTNYGYNQLQLAFGNGGCRFLLDDMSLSFAGTTMTSDTVKTNITNGNISFNGDSRYLTESEMDSIIAYANNKGIEIVPMLNMPGHATAIVYDTSYASNGNLNVNSEAARNYGAALLAKYVTYFKGQGCKYFHFGSDESGYSGTDMTAFLTACAKVITDAGMTPRAFNDATNVATMPKSVQITYWHKETQSQYAFALNAAGYQMINTHGRWYYVIKSDQGPSEAGTKYWNGTVNTSEVSVELPVMKAEKMDGKWVGINEYFDFEPPYGSIISNSLGTMFCIWCDASQDSYLTDSDVISENENYGALYQLEKMAEHYWPGDIKIPGSTAPTVTLQDGSALPAAIKVGEALSLKASKTVSWTTSDNSVIELTSDNSVIELTSAANGESKTIEGTNVLATAKKAGTAIITVTDEDGNTAFYTITVQDASQAETVNVALTVGESTTFDVDSSVNAGSYITGDNEYIATAEVARVEGVTETTVSTIKATTVEDGASYIMRVYNTNYALTTNTGKSDWGTRTLAFETYTAAEDDNVWTLEASAGGYKLKSATGYLVLGTGNNTAYTDTTGEIFTLTSTSTGWTVKNPSDKYINALGGIENLTAGGWSGDGTRFDLYKVTKATDESSTLTITGVGESTTDVTVGNVTYHITVTAPSKTDSTTLSHGGSFTLPNGAADVTVTSGREYVTVNGATITAGNTDGTATITYTVKNGGGYVTARYTHTVTVSAINFGSIEPLKVQLWITNTWVGADAPPTSLQIVNVSAAEANKEDGVALRSFVPSPAYRTDNADIPVIYWKGVALHGEKPVKQGADLSTNHGDIFTTIRYWESSWQYLNNNVWTTIDTSDNDNADTIVAYYLETNDVSPEITTAAQHYGNPPTNDPENTETQYGLTAFAVVYPDGTLSRTEEEMYRTGMLRGFWGGSQYDLGTIYAENNSTYRVSKMTVTWGAHIRGTSRTEWYTESTGYGGNQGNAYGTTWGINWEKKTNSAGVKWYDETTYWRYGDSDIPMIDGDKLGLKITTERNAALVLIYLEVVETENTLSVVYWDDNANSQITTNPMPLRIVVKPNVTFLNGIQNSGEIHPGDITLSDEAYIENSSGATQKFNKELSTVPGVGGAYLSGMYKYVGAKVSEDGLTLTLHFDLNEAQYQQTFVVDFGLPLVIRATDFGLENTNQIESVSLERGNETLTHEGTYGTATIAGDYQTVTYTLKKPLGSGRATIPLFVTYQGQAEPKLFQAHVIPASNVLYEENFLTPDAGSEWTRGTTSSAPTDPQETQKVVSVDENLKFNVFGFDGVYDDKIGETGVWKADNLDSSKLTAPLTTSFYGNGFDLIGNCGQNTGRVLMIISPADGSKSGARVIDVDTRYNGDSLYQVPLAHVEFNNDAAYNVKIWASGLDKTTASTSRTATASLMDTYSAADDALLQSLVQSYGLSMSDVEHVTMSNVIPASGAADVSLYGMPSAAALTAEPQTNVEHQQGTHVEIDSFRVYRTTDKDDDIAGKYPVAEQGIVYNNILDVVKGQIIAFTEGNSNTTIQITDYEAAGGPQNEIYIGKGQAISFRVEGATEIQVSLRAVTNAPAKWATSENGGAVSTISTNTEMYYTITKDTSDNFVIANRGDALLAIGNVKLPSGAKTMSASEIDEDALRASLCAALGLSAEQPQAFQPMTFTARATTLPMLRNKRVSVLITISNDVSYVTVNGVKYTPSRYYASWQKTRLIQFGETLGKYESKTYTIIAYDANGVASAPITVNG